MESGQWAAGLAAALVCRPTLPVSPQEMLCLHGRWRTPGTSEPLCGWHDSVRRPGDLGVEGMSAKGPPNQAMHVSVAALRSHRRSLQRPAVRAQASLSNHSGCDLKMDSVLWYSSQSHSTFQSDLKSEPL